MKICAAEPTKGLKQKLFAKESRRVLRNLLQEQLPLIIKNEECSQNKTNFSDSIVPRKIKADDVQRDVRFIETIPNSKLKIDLSHTKTKKFPGRQ